MLAVIDFSRGCLTPATEFAKAEMASHSYEWDRLEDIIEEELEAARKGFLSWEEMKWAEYQAKKAWDDGVESFIDEHGLPPIGEVELL